MKYFIILVAILLSIVIVGCSSISYKHRGMQNLQQNALCGSWYAIDSNYIRNGLQVQKTAKEQFFNNGQLLSSKWFHYRDKAGRDLGEYYVTKLFTWRKRGNRVVARFQRCSVGVTQELKAPNLGLKELKRVCQRSYAHKGRVTIKRFRFLNGNRLMLGDKIYQKE